MPLTFEKEEKGEQKEVQTYSERVMMDKTQSMRNIMPVQMQMQGLISVTSPTARIGGTSQISQSPFPANVYHEQLGIVNVGVTGLKKKL